MSDNEVVHPVTTMSLRDIAERFRRSGNQFEMSEDRISPTEFWDHTIKMLKDTTSELQVIVRNLDNIKTHTTIPNGKIFYVKDFLFNITKLTAKIQSAIDNQTT